MLDMICDNTNIQDDLDIELSVLSDANAAMIQADAALRVIRATGRVPKYMRTVSRGTLIQACFESSEYSETVDALESFSESLSDRWKKIKYAIGRWKTGIMNTALVAGTIAIVHKTVMFIKKATDISNAFSSRTYTAMLNDSISPAVIKVTSIKNNRRFTLSRTSVDLTELHKKLSNPKYFHALSTMETEAADRAQNRIANIITRRMNRASFKLMGSFILLLVAVSGMGLMTRNTPEALYKVASLKLPTDKDGLDSYITSVVDTINGGTAFTIFTTADNLKVHTGGASATMHKVLDTVTTTARDIGAAIKERSNIERRFIKLADLLQVRIDEASKLDNTYATDAATFTSAVCKAVIDECMSSGTTVTRIAASLDKFMDKFHEEANTD